MCIRDTKMVFHWKNIYWITNWQKFTKSSDLVIVLVGSGVTGQGLGLCASASLSLSKTLPDERTGVDDTCTQGGGRRGSGQRKEVTEHCCTLTLY